MRAFRASLLLSPGAEAVARDYGHGAFGEGGHFRLEFLCGHGPIVTRSRPMGPATSCMGPFLSSRQAPTMMRLLFPAHLAANKADIHRSPARLPPFEPDAPHGARPWRQDRRTETDGAGGRGARAPVMSLNPEKPASCASVLMSPGGRGGASGQGCRNHKRDASRMTLVRTAGVEPAQPKGRRILSPLRLPVSPRPHRCALFHRFARN